MCSIYTSYFLYKFCAIKPQNKYRVFIIKKSKIYSVLSVLFPVGANKASLSLLLMKLLTPRSLVKTSLVLAANDKILLRKARNQIADKRGGGGQANADNY